MKIGPSRARSAAGKLKRRSAIVMVVTALTVLLLGPQPSAADHAPHPVLVARGTFIDDVGAQVKVKLDGQRRDVMNVKDASDLVVVEISLANGVIAPWHDHSGPALLINNGPGTLTSVHSDDCVPRDYPPGTALVDPGGGNLHSARNGSGQDLVLYVIFLAVETAPVLPADPPAECDPF